MEKEEEEEERGVQHGALSGVEQGGGEVGFWGYFTRGVLWSDNLLDAGSLEAARAALLLDLASRPMTSAPPAGQGRAGRQLHVFLVHAWGVLRGGE